jgi:hypothetical protein
MCSSAEPEKPVLEPAAPKSEPEVRVPLENISYSIYEPVPNLSVGSNKIVVSDSESDSDSDIGSQLDSDSDSESEISELPELDNLVISEDVEDIDLGVDESLKVELELDTPVLEKEVAVEVEEDKPMEVVYFDLGDKPEPVQEVVQELEPEPESIEEPVQEVSKPAPLKLEELRKMNINQLKAYAISSGISADTSKMKKHEIISLLQST